MPLSPQPVTWPLTAGLAGKTNPLSVQPGSHLALVDVKQERADEWRNRQGFDAAAVSPGPVMVGSPSNGGAVFLADADGDVLRFYSPDTSSSTFGASYRDRPASWERIPVNVSTFAQDPTQVDCAATSTTVMSLIGVGVTYYPAIYSKSTKSQISSAAPLASFLSGRVGAIGERFVIVTADNAGNVVARTYSATGTSQRTDTVHTGGHTVNPWLDVFYFTGSTITIVVRTGGNQIRFIEYDPTTGSTATANLTLAVNADNCLVLLPDPDASGTRYVGVSNATPSTRVLRVTAAGAISSNEQAEAIAATQIAGVAYTAGAEWQIVYKTSGGVKGCKKSTTIGAAAFIGGAARTDLDLKSGAWREPGTDPTRVLLGINVSAALETQNTYLEYSFSFTGGNAFTAIEEPQSILLPLDGWSGPALNSTLPRAVRDSARSFWTSLVRTASTTNQTPNYSIDLWRAQYPAAAASNIGQLNVGRPVECAGSLWFPSGSLFAFEPGPCPSHGVPFFPRAPSALSQSAVGGTRLTLLSTYQYQIGLVVYDTEGRIWRSPLSEPTSITLTGANDTVSGTYDHRTMPCIVDVAQVRAIVAYLFRTAGNGSVFQLIAQNPNLLFGSAWNWTDGMSDVTLAGKDFLYTISELETAITPRPAHIATWGDRMWLANADFRTELWFSKHIRPGHQPEFSGEFVIDFDDEFGDITGLAQLDDKLVVFKRNAIYLVAGDGPEDNGSGTIHATARIDFDVGCLPGPPPISTGEEVFFVSERGIKSVDRAGQVSDHVGDGVSDFFEQPTIRTPITVTDVVFVRAKNEIRFLYSGGQLVYDRTHKIWYRWVGGLTGYTLSAVVGGKQMLFNATAALIENPTATTDNGVTYQGTIRSAWIRANESAMRLYKANVTGARTPGGANVSPTLTVFLDNSDVAVQSFSPPGPIPGATTPIQAEARPQRQTCASFSLQVQLPQSDATVRLERWGAVVGVRGAPQKRSDSERWT